MQNGGAQKVEQPVRLADQIRQFAVEDSLRAAKRRQFANRFAVVDGQLVSRAQRLGRGVRRQQRGQSGRRESSPPRFRLARTGAGRRKQEIGIELFQFEQLSEPGRGLVRNRLRALLPHGRASDGNHADTRLRPPGKRKEVRFPARAPTVANRSRDGIADRRSGVAHLDGHEATLRRIGGHLEKNVVTLRGGACGDHSCALGTDKDRRRFGIPQPGSRERQGLAEGGGVVDRVERPAAGAHVLNSSRPPTLAVLGVDPELSGHYFDRVGRAALSIHRHGQRRRSQGRIGGARSPWKRSQAQSPRFSRWLG